MATKKQCRCDSKSAHQLYFNQALWTIYIYISLLDRAQSSTSKALRDRPNTMTYAIQNNKLSKSSQRFCRHRKSCLGPAKQSPRMLPEAAPRLDVSGHQLPSLLSHAKDINAASHSRTLIVKGHLVLPGIGAAQRRRRSREKRFRREACIAARCVFEKLRMRIKSFPDFS